MLTHATALDHPHDIDRGGALRKLVLAGFEPTRVAAQRCHDHRHPRAPNGALGFEVTGNGRHTHVGRDLDDEGALLQARRWPDHGGGSGHRDRGGEERGQEA